MEEFCLLRERWEARARDESARFWERRGCAAFAEGPLSEVDESTAPPAKASCEGILRNGMRLERGDGVSEVHVDVAIRRGVT